MSDLLNYINNASPTTENFYYCLKSSLTIDVEFLMRFTIFLALINDFDCPVIQNPVHFSTLCS